jgi:hypothetical protein
MLRFLAVAILCVGIAGATGFTNGSFSCAGDPDSDPTSCGFTVPSGAYWQYLPLDSTAIAGWTVGGEGINWVYEYDPSNGKGWETTVSGDGGHYSVGLQGNSAGTWTVGMIYQAFDTVPGQKYQLDYLYSMAPAAAATKAFVDATVRGEGLATQVITYTLASHPTYVGNSNLAWAAGFYEWTAIGTTTVIAFQSAETGDNRVGGIILDGLVFREDSDVPEPGTMSLMFGAGLLGLGLLIRRKR